MPLLVFAFHHLLGKRPQFLLSLLGYLHRIDVTLAALKVKGYLLQRQLVDTYFII
jgi:hypothetical protein